MNTLEITTKTPLTYEQMLAAGLFVGGKAYYCHHKLANEDWYIIGISHDFKKACAAGWPASIANISDCDNWEVKSDLTEKEIEYRNKTFGNIGWL